MLKGNFSKFLAELLSETLRMHEIEVVECRHFCCCFTKSDSTVGALSAILKMLANICNRVNFEVSYRCRLDSSNCCATKDVFLRISEIFKTTVFRKSPNITEHNWFS